MILENDFLEVDFVGNLPIIRTYHHKPTGERFFGGSESGLLQLNGKNIAWDQWKIDVKESAKSKTFLMRYEDVSFVWEYSLKENILCINVKEIEGPLRILGFNGTIQLGTESREYSFTQIGTSDPDMSVGGKMWMYEKSATLNDVEIQDFSRNMINGCLFHPEKVCAFINSNYPLFPTRHEYCDGKYSIILNDYHYQARKMTMFPLQVKMVFLEDYNKDGIIDGSDFALWTNNVLPDADKIYCESISYKIFLTMRKTPVYTNYEQAEEIIRAIYNVTGGLPQIVYLVGVFFQGHDDKYPAMSKHNSRAGTINRLRQLFKDCKEKYNTTLSYHANIDDAYLNSPEWDPSYMSKRGVVHTLDWEEGHFLRRMNDMLKIFPLEKTFHIDNTRTCNTQIEKKEGIGHLEEIYCGLLPIAEWFKERGISLTTEGSNGIPMDGTLLFDGWFHHAAEPVTRQMLHRKIAGGGYGGHWGNHPAYDYGMGSNIHVDFTYHPRHTCISYTEDFMTMVNQIYLGSFLYLYFLERQMTVARKNGKYKAYFEYDDGTTVELKSRHEILVKKDDMIIALDNEDRCIPYKGALYVFSKSGGVKTFTLPPDMRGKKLKIEKLSRTGTREVFPDDRAVLDYANNTLNEKVKESLEFDDNGFFEWKDDKIIFSWMSPDVPFKVTVDE